MTFSFYINGNGGFVGNYLNQSFIGELISSYENIFLYAGRSMDPNVIIAVNDTRSAMQEFSILEKKSPRFCCQSIVFFPLPDLEIYPYK